MTQEPVEGNEKRQRKKGKKGLPLPPGGFWNSFLTTLFIFLLLVSLYSFLTSGSKEDNTISLTQLAEDIAAAKIKTVIVRGNDLEITYKDDTQKMSKKEEDAALSETLKNYGVTLEALSTIDIEVQGEGGFRFWFLNLAPFIVPLLLLGFFIWFLTRQVRGAGMQAFTFGQSRPKIIDPSDKNQRVTFQDVAGAKEAKEELVEVVDFLKNPKKFLDIGARIPKGVLLMGAAGTGKTLLARAVAGEAGVPFFSISGSEFVEMFVGVGASVTGDTPVLVRRRGAVALKPIAEVVDPHYAPEETSRIKKTDDLEALGFISKETGFRGASGEKKFFGGSRWSKVAGVYRHKVDRVYRIRYRGGEIRTTGDHSVFVRSRNMIVAKRTDELKRGEVLINLPFRVRGAFVPAFGTAHETRGHRFEEPQTPLVLDVFGDEAFTLQNAYATARATAGSRSSYSAAEELGVSQTTIVNWRNGWHNPKFLISKSARQTPSRIVVTEELMRLLGYFAAEGDATEWYARFTFGSHETELHNDVVSLLRFVFNQKARIEHNQASNSTRIIISSRPIAEFFKRHCGTGSHRKRVPTFLWDLPKRYFLSYLDGYARGDGYTTKEGKLSITSVAYEHIRELAWLSAMHGIAAGICETRAPAGRTIGKNTKPLPETRAWNLIIGKTSHLFLPFAGTRDQPKRPVIESVTEEPYEGYVYDLCGCDNEAFFGGEKPLLLHNSRVRDLFKMAKKAAPAIIFVDEIDAVGRVRGTGVGGGNDEREQTLNQILVEMDGFEPNEKVVVLAATNRPDVLDPALIRPGRFDRRVVIDLPDRKDRLEILKIHARKKPFAEDVNLELIAERTPGFSGADLYSVMNEGAILAARENRKKVSQFDLIRSIEKVMLGPERRSHVLNVKEKEITAFHEAGHALVSSVLPYADPVHKISIISRGRAAGYTLKLPLEDKKMQSKNEFLDDIATSLGGYVAELAVFGDITTGPHNDLSVASALARDMVMRYGMSDKLGPMAFEGEGSRAIAGRGIGEREHSEKVAAEIDAEVKRIIDESKRRAEDIIKKHRRVLDSIARRLVEAETIEQKEFQDILIANGIEPKRKDPRIDTTEKLVIRD